MEMDVSCSWLSESAKVAKSVYHLKFYSRLAGCEVLPAGLGFVGFQTHLSLVAVRKLFW